MIFCLAHRKKIGIKIGRQIVVLCDMFDMIYNNSVELFRYVLWEVLR